MPPSVTVAQSKIDCQGVYAAADFAPGVVILTIDDSYLVDDEHPVPPGEAHHCDYLEAAKSIWMQPPECFINHSCDPNVYVKTLDGFRRVVSLRQIAVGEEVVYDFCVNSSGDVVWQCNCGAPRCRQTIHSDFFHLPLELQKEYLPLLDDWFLQERSADVEVLMAALSAEHPG